MRTFLNAKRIFLYSGKAFISISSKKSLRALGDKYIRFISIG
jgi:hypothetical protein